jgi:hypothetical protein
MGGRTPYTSALKVLALARGYSLSALSTALHIFVSLAPLDHSLFFSLTFRSEKFTIYLLRESFIKP